MPTITLDRERSVKYRLPGIKRLRAEHGIQIMKLGNENGGPDTEDLETWGKLLWAGLLHEDPQLEMATIEPFIGFHNITEIVKVVGEALTEGMPPENPPSPSA